MKHTKLILIASIAGFLISCDNPADETSDATITEQQAVATSSEDAVTYTFTSDSVINFVGSKVTDSHEGGFKVFKGSFTLDNGTPKSGSFTIQMDSIWSDDEKLTGHLKNEDFFNVTKFPTSEFKVTGFKKLSDSSYTVSGNLTMVGVTKNITFPANVAVVEEKFVLSSEFDINRKDWGIVYAGMADNLIQDEVVLNFKLVTEKATKAHDKRVGAVAAKARLPHSLYAMHSSGQIIGYKMFCTPVCFRHTTC